MAGAVPGRLGYDVRSRGRMSADADPRHLAAALVAAHQGGTMITYATGSAEPTSRRA